MQARNLRIGTFDPSLVRRGPGLLLQDIVRSRDAQIAAVADVIARVDPDVLLLTGIDYDRDLMALGALRDRLRALGADYPVLFAFPPNTGVATGLDIDGDGQADGPRDAQGYGWFPGQGGMALLSRLPIDEAASRDLSAFLWRDLPGSGIAGAGLSAAARDRLRLSSTGHWDVVLKTARGPLHLLAYAATPPVFDGPEDRNGRRNRDETAFWGDYLDGRLPFPAPLPPFVILGKINLDPAAGEGRKDAIRALLSDPRVQDARPGSPGAAEAAHSDPSADAALATASWSRRSSDAAAKEKGPHGTGPAHLRVDYVLPSTDLRVTGAGVFWPDAEDPDSESALAASPHRLVWVDISLE